MDRIRIKKGKGTIIFAIFIVVLLVVINAYNVSVSTNLISENNEFEERIDSMIETIFQDNLEISKLEDIKVIQDVEIENLVEENVQLKDCISYRDNTITERDKTIVELNNDMISLRWDYQEAKNKIEFPSSPYIIGEMNSSVLYEFLIEFTDDDTYIYFGDTNYKLTTVSEIERFLRWDTTNKFLYEVEIFDCDDFSSRLNGQFAVPGWSELSFGMICSKEPYETGSHVYNVFVTEENGELVLYSVEPQNDDIHRIMSLEGVSFIIFS